MTDLLSTGINPKLHVFVNDCGSDLGRYTGRGTSKGGKVLFLCSPSGHRSSYRTTLSTFLVLVHHRTYSDKMSQPSLFFCLFTSPFTQEPYDR